MKFARDIVVVGRVEISAGVPFQFLARGPESRTSSKSPVHIYRSDGVQGDAWVRDFQPAQVEPADEYYSIRGATGGGSFSGGTKHTRMVYPLSESKTSNVLERSSGKNKEVRSEGTEQIGRASCRERV